MTVTNNASERGSKPYTNCAIQDKTVSQVAHNLGFEYPQYFAWIIQTER
jgi:hypothetical protein